jgi:AcrR family transcriptional regulator
VAIGRPRRVADSEVMAAVRGALLEQGYARLTVAEVARRLGVTPAAVGQRFGGKRELMLAYFELWNARAAEPEGPGAGSPLDRLLQIALADVDDLGGPVAVANALSAFVDVVGDPELRAVAQAAVRHQRSRYRAVLAEAMAAGLVPRGDTERLAAVLAAGVTGAQLHWAVLEDRPRADAIREHVLAVLGRTDEGRAT